MILAGALLVAPGAGAQSAVASAKDPKLAGKLSSVLSDKRVTRARTAVAVVDAGDGTHLYNHYATRATTPASNTKIVTAVAALHTLGPAFRFKTQAIRR